MNETLTRRDGGTLKILGVSCSEEKLAFYRRWRDQIRAFVETLPEAFQQKNV